MFGGHEQIATFSTFQPILLMLGILLITGVQTRIIAAVTGAIMVWHMANIFSIDKSTIANLNGFKREFAFLAAGIVIALRGGGNAYTGADIIECIRYSLGKPSSYSEQIDLPLKS